MSNELREHAVRDSPDTERREVLVSVRKTLILAMALLLLVSTGATAASKRVNWSFSGASIGGIVLDEPSGCWMLLINFQAKGSPGSATVFGLNRDCPNPADGENRHRRDIQR